MLWVCFASELCRQVSSHCGSMCMKLCINYMFSVHLFNYRLCSITYLWVARFSHAFIYLLCIISLFDCLFIYVIHMYVFMYVFTHLSMYYLLSCMHVFIELFSWLFVYLTDYLFMYEELLINS